MNRLSDNDKQIGPLTIGSWHRSFAIYFDSGDHDEDHHNRIMLTGFGRAFRLRLPDIVRPFGKYREHSRRFGVSLSDMGNGYDFVQVFFGPQTMDSSTTKDWCCHLPWKEWRHVRHSLYRPDGSHFYTDPPKGDFRDFMTARDQCPKTRFEFEDFDGERIVATCHIEEREWRFGTGWFKWLSRFRAPKIRRYLDLAFSSEVGPGKGSWKGGTVGHSCDMHPGDTPESAFRRYCSVTHKHKGREYALRFIGGVE